VVNQAAVRHLFGGRNPIGSRLTFENPTDSAAQWVTIVGVVRDIHHAGLGEPPYPQVYLPAAQAPRRWVVLVARTDSQDPLVLGELTRQAIAGLDPDLALSEVRTMEQRVAGATARPRVSAIVLGGFALAALLLAAIGIYGVVSYGVLQRTREVGIRMALGASESSVLAMVLRQGMAPVVVGMAAGLGMAWAATRVLRSLLFQVGTADPATFVAVTAFLGCAALLACYLPARRAARSDPVAALRAE
jgi:putative ABC transport system permease protein